MAVKDLDVNARDIFGYTAVMHAIVQRHDDVVRLLLDCATVDVNAKEDLTDWTVLMGAIECQNVEAARMILELRSEVEVNALSTHGDSAYSIAIGTKNVDLIQLLKPYSS